MRLSSSSSSAARLWIARTQAGLPVPATGLLRSPSSRRQHARVPGGSGPSRRRTGGAGRVLAVSVPERQTVTDRTPPPPPPEVEVKVVGIGSRGAYAINKLIQHSQVWLGARWSCGKA